MPIGRLKQALKVRLGERGGLLHSVGTLVGGTAFAQGLGVLALPILTRLYTPAEFSVLAVYASILGVLSVAACLRLEIAIPLPKCDQEAANLALLALASGVATTAITGLFLTLFHSAVSEWIHVPALVPYLWLIPIGVFVSSIFSVGQYWATRKKKFSIISSTRMAQSLSGAGVQIGAGIIGFGAVGLLVGQIFNAGAGVLRLSRSAWQEDKGEFCQVSLASMRAALVKYSRFPTYSTLEALGSTAGLQIPIILIAAISVGPEAGYLMLAMRILAVPISLLGNTLAQVYLAHAADEFRNGRLGVFTARIFEGTFRIGVGPLVFAGIIAKPAFGIAFGGEWQRAGVLLAWLTPWFVLKLVSSPVSMVMQIAGEQVKQLVVTTVGFLLRIVMMGLAYLFANKYMPEVFAVSGAILYGVSMAVYANVAGVRARDVCMMVIRCKWIIFSWVLCGFAVRIILMRFFGFA